MNQPKTDRIDAENPEWTEEDFANAIPFSALPAEMQALLDSPKAIQLAPEAKSDRPSAA